MDQKVIIIFEISQTNTQGYSISQFILVILLQNGRVEIIRITTRSISGTLATFILIFEKLREYIFSEHSDQNHLLPVLIHLEE